MGDARSMMKPANPIKVEAMLIGTQLALQIMRA